MTILDLILAICATCQIVETLHHGTIFLPLRIWAARESIVGRSAWRCLLGELISCPFCLSHWAGGAAIGLTIASIWFRPFVWPVWIAGTVRLANLLNDLPHHWCRSPRGISAVETELSDDATTESVSLEPNGEQHAA